MAEYYIKQGDDSPAILTTLRDGEGEIVSLVGATVRFILRPVNGETVLDEEADLVGDGSGGQVEYAWPAAITYPPGSYYGEWQVTFVSNEVQSFPTIGYDSIEILEELGTEQDVSIYPPIFATISDLEGATGSDLQDNATAIRYLETASQAIRDWLDQRVEYVEDEEIVMWGNGLRLMTLPEMPIVSITEVLPESAEDPLDASDYEIEGRSGLRRLGNFCWAIGERYHITYSHGYAVKPADVLAGAPLLPSTIREATIQLAGDRLLSVGVGGGGVVSETIGIYTYKVDSDTSSGESLAVSGDMKLLLERYRQAGVA